MIVLCGFFAISLILIVFFICYITTCDCCNGKGTFTYTFFYLAKAGFTVAINSIPILFNFVKFSVCCYIILIYCYILNMLYIMHCLVNRHCDRWLPNKSAFKEFKGKINPPKKWGSLYLVFNAFIVISQKFSLYFPRRKRTNGFILLSFLPQWKLAVVEQGTQKQQRERGRVTGTQKEDSDDEESTSLLNMVIIWNCFVSKSLMCVIINSW